jgi:hypothetical protein
MKRIVIGSLVLLAATSAPCAAQHIGIMGGWVDPYSSTGDVAKAGWDAGITLQLGAPLVPIQFRIDGTYNLMDGKPVGGAYQTTSNFTIWSGTGNIVWTVFGTALPTKIYLIGGIGYYSVQQKVTVTGALPPPPALTAGTVTTPAFGYNLGLGVRFTKLFIEARWNDVQSGYVDNGLQKKALQFVPINVGLLF